VCYSSWGGPQMTDKSSVQSISETLRDIRKSIDLLNRKMDLLLKERRSTSKSPLANNDTKLRAEGETSKFYGFDVVTLLSLPDHLRKTAMTISHLREASAGDIANETHRARAAESDYLNQLVTMGYLKKRRRGRTAYFYIEE